ncbi:glycosyltransferase family 4 protein [Marinibactrum halimedae]|uniref:Glycosyl transferase n=1 Tax=Marinibactrum halimedae TaxID=1444977 RepID=A0AA37WMY9_9GAMM|nr:glycosyltransferase family 4 protein [Marinibactrum halimedae]MCD9461068.1 glycosyltransferase family 4 protein [Marinibactrum halimedae]GLS26735.1 glycosyl transferase [Marinibactrum halimedae]
MESAVSVDKAIFKTGVVIGWVWPEPTSSAAGSHVLSILDVLKESCEELWFVSSAQPGERAADLSSLGIHSRTITLNCSSFDDFLLDVKPDVVMFDRFMMEEQYGWRVQKNCPDALRILDTEDLQCLRGARQSAYKQQRDVRPEDYRSDLVLRELASIYRSDLSLMISEAEIRFLHTEFQVPDYLLHYFPLLVSDDRLQQVQTTLTPFEARSGFCCIGNFRHAPNWDSVLWLRELWPEIRRCLPTAELSVYGAYLPPKAKALDNAKIGFHVKGWVPDAYAAVSQARVCLAPLRFGAGLKGKMIDAMCAGTPIVTTTIGAEGFLAEGEFDWPGVVVDDPSGLVDAAVALYQQPERWKVAQQCGVNLLSERFQEGWHQQALQQAIREAEQEKRRRRLKNIVGAMLRHHHQASTQYLSQWIEAKTRLEAQQASSN